LDDLAYKNLTREELDYIFKGKDFKADPRWHQLVSLAFASSRTRVAYFHGIGTGKTPSALYTLQMWGCKRVLVVCPTSAMDAWEEAIPKFTDFSYQFLTGTRTDRRYKLKLESNISVINYEGLKSLYASLVRSQEKDGRGSWEIDPLSFDTGFDCVVFDEIHKCSNYKTLQSKICVELSKRSGNIIGLSGTPIDKSLLDLFNIYYTLDFGKSLGNNFFCYRTKYFYKAGFNWKPKKGVDQEILSKLSDSTISFDRDECFDLPELQEVDLWLEPSNNFNWTQKAIIDGDPIDTTVGKSSCNQANGVIADTDSKRVTLLRQIPSGFLYCGDGYRGGYLTLNDNPKLVALMDALDGTGSHVIIFYQYMAEYDIISASLKSKKISFVSINGSHSQKEKRANIQKFRGGKFKVMLAHPNCASEGFDGTVANVLIFFTPISSPKVRNQCIGRIWRSGQKEKSLVINLLLKGSIDKVRIDSRNDRTSVVKLVMEFIKNYHL